MPEHLKGAGILQNGRHCPSVAMQILEVGTAF
jgi:hypothetical protein